MINTSLSPILIAGPTASGKSALALQIAQRSDSVIVNADSMQVYRELSIITARPSAVDEAEAEHALYGHVSAAEPYSVARWLEDVTAVLAQCLRRNKRPIIVGGTGLYFKALSGGLSPIPKIPDDVRAHWRQEAQRLPSRDLHAQLSTRDPEMASRLSQGDVQRITRALEVFEATGRSLADWQRVPGRPAFDETGVERLLVLPPRDKLQQRCDLRFDTMIESGTLDEVRKLVALGLSLDAPAMRALGVPPLSRHLAGEITLAQAVAQAKAETRRYVKRQETWLKRNMNAWKPIQTT